MGDLVIATLRRAHRGKITRDESVCHISFWKTTQQFFPILWTSSRIQDHLSCVNLIGQDLIVLQIFRLIKVTLEIFNL
jgi:hypothetical protein